jgi:hypothetical protein
LAGAAAPARAATTTYSGGLLFRLPYRGSQVEKIPLRAPDTAENA